MPLLEDKLKRNVPLDQCGLKVCNHHCIAERLDYQRHLLDRDS